MMHYELAKITDTIQ